MNHVAEVIKKPSGAREHVGAKAEISLIDYTLSVPSRPGLCGADKKKAVRRPRRPASSLPARLSPPVLAKFRTERRR
jgi:hypothetical protein